MSGQPDILANVEWLPVEAPADPGGLPFPTHQGMTEIAGHKLRCFQLNTGERVFDADDVEAFFKAAMEDTPP